MKFTEKRCLECGEIITGRIDKKFCTDQCRNTYNNRLNSNSTNYVRNVNNLLRKNRRILESLNRTDKKNMVSKELLLSRGFNFNFHTNTYTTQKGHTYYFCYEQGYLFLEDKGQYLLVTQREWDN